MVEHLGIFRMETRQLEGDLDGLVVLLEAGIRALELQAAESAEGGVGRLAEGFAQAGQRILEVAQLGEAQGQEDVDIGQVGFQLKRLTQAGDRLGIMAVAGSRSPSCACTSAVAGDSSRSFS